MIELIIVPWAIILSVYTIAVVHDKVYPFYLNQKDILTGGSKNPLYSSYINILAHLIEKPEEWRADKDIMRFPKDSKISQFIIQKDNDDIEISIDSINNGRFIKLNGYFKKQFAKQLEKQYKDLALRVVIKNLFPDKYPIMIENKKDSV